MHLLTLTTPNYGSKAAFTRQTKRPSQFKLVLANSYWQTKIGVCEQHNYLLTNCWREQRQVLFLANGLPTCCCFVHTHEFEFCQHELANISLTCEGLLTLANSCWQTQIGVCERRNMLANCWRQIELDSILANFSPTVCQHVVVSFTHVNLSLPTRVGQH